MTDRQADALRKKMEFPRGPPQRGAAFALQTWLLDPKRLLYVLMFLAIGSLLATRPIGLAPDDFNYLQYFEGADWFRFIEHSKLQGYSLMVEEPLWQLLVHVLSSYLDAESAFRLVIFCSVAMYAWAFRKAPSSALLFVLFAFLVCPFMAVEMYFNQVRQGFATSLFLALLSLGGWGYVVGAFTSGLVHTSLLTLLPLSAIGTKALVISVGAMLIGIAALAVGGLEFFASDLDLGRRADQYAFEGAASYRFFFYAVPLYFGIFGLVWYEHVRLKRAPEPIFYQSLVYCVLAFVAAYGFEAGVRLFYLLDALVIWTVSRFWRGRVPLGAWLWACAQLAVGFYVSFKGNFAALETQWGRVEAIFASW